MANRKLGFRTDLSAGTEGALSYRIRVEFPRKFPKKLSQIFLLTTEVNSSTMRNVCGDTLQIFPLFERIYARTSENER